MSKKWIITLLIIAFACFFGTSINKGSLVRAYWKTRTVLSNFTVNHPAAAEKIFPNFDPMFKDEYLSINEKPLVDDRTDLSFFVIGHVYADENVDAFHPPIDLITNVQKINDKHADFVILLGDLVPKPTNKEFMNLENYLLQPFSMPVFNAVGNHDVLDRNAYQNRYGKTVYSFPHKGYLFIFLDTNIESCSLSADQYEFITSEIESHQRTNDIKGVVLLMHHVLFLDKTKPWMDDIWQTNTQCLNTAEFSDFINNELIRFSEKTPVHIFAGDVGKTGSHLSPYYEKLVGNDVYLYATGLGNSNEDSILYIQEVDDTLKIEAFALDGREMQSIEKYDYTYWIEDKLEK